MRAAPLIGAALVLIALGGRAEAEPSEAERLYHEGQEAYDEQRYDAALALWQRSYELSRQPALLFNLAQAYRLRDGDGDCARAVASYKKFVRLDPDSPRLPTARTWIRELAECAEDSPDEPDAPASAPDPDAPSGRPGALARSRSEPRPDRSSEQSGGASKRLAGMIVAGGGAVTALVGVYFGDRARRLGDEVSKACASGCAWSTFSSKDADGRSAERTQWILYGVGASGLIAGVVLYSLSARERTAAVAVTPRKGGGLLAWSLRW